MDEVILWEHRKSLIKYICINNYSIIHARHILNNKHFKYKKQVLQFNGKTPDLYSAKSPDQRAIQVRILVGPPMSIEEIKEAYIKIYGDRWKEVFAKYYWCVYNSETGECKHIDIKCFKCPNRK